MQGEKITGDPQNTKVLLWCSYSTVLCPLEPDSGMGVEDSPVRHALWIPAGAQLEGMDSKSLLSR